jgi:hypothetical protein
MLRNALIYVFLVLLAGCAGLSPEAKLKAGYDSASGFVRTATVLTDRDRITVQDAENVSAMSKTGKATLDSGATKLAECRAAEAASGTTDNSQCSAAFSTINLGSGVLLQLEKYLKERSK